MSVVLNYIERYTRRKGMTCGEFKQFVKISYGSLKESEYLIYFSYTEEYLEEGEYKKLSELASIIGGILYGIMKKSK